VAKLADGIVRSFVRFSFPLHGVSGEDVVVVDDDVGFVGGGDVMG
jgi:hypothetical protein